MLFSVGNGLITHVSCHSATGGSAMGFVFVACGISSDDMFLLLLSLPANEAGETPLDIARRLKHLQCEELVSLLCLDLAYACINTTL